MRPVPTGIPGEPVSRHVWSISLVGFVVMCGGQVVAVVLPLQAAEFGRGPAAAGVLVASFFLARLAADLYGAAAGGRHTPERWLQSGGLFLALASFVAALASSFPVLLGARAGQGLGVATILLALFRQLLGHRRGMDLPRGIARFQMAQLVGILVGPMVGGAVAASLGMFAPHWVLGATGLVVAFLGGRSKSAHRDDTTDDEGEAPVIAANKRIAKYWLVVALVMEFSIFIGRVGGQLTVMPLMAAVDVGLSPARIGVVLAVSGAAHLVAMPIAVRVTRHADRRLACAGAMAGMGLTIIVHAGVTGYPGLLLASTATGLISSLAFMLPAVIVSEVVPDGSMSRILGVYRASGSLGSVLGPIAAGAVAGVHGTRSALIVCGGFVALASSVLVAKR